MYGHDGLHLLAVAKHFNLSNFHSPAHLHTQIGSHSKSWHAHYDEMHILKWTKAFQWSRTSNCNHFHITKAVWTIYEWQRCILVRAHSSAFAGEHRKRAAHTHTHVQVYLAMPSKHLSNFYHSYRLSNIELIGSGISRRAGGVITQPFQWEQNSWFCVHVPYSHGWRHWNPLAILLLPLVIN